MVYYWAESVSNMATSSITANFAINDPKEAQAFAAAFVRNSRKATTPVVMPWRIITSADAVPPATCKTRVRARKRAR